MRAWLAADLSGSGGRLLNHTDDFRVREILAYSPCGSGEHLLVQIDKIGLTTPEAAARLAKAAGVPERAVGFAGMKDKHARARQWMSLPLPLRAAVPDLSAADCDELRVLSAGRHKNKIKRGHNRGNRFSIVVRDVPSGGAERAAAVLARLRTTGVPNGFGPQRAGRDGDNADRALAVIRGQARAPKSRRIRSLLISALQSRVFDHVLALRIERGDFARALAGDVMKKHDTGGLFDVTDPVAEQPRVDRLEISPTAALPGPRARAASGEPQEMEQEAIVAVGLTPDDIARLDSGTRRVLRYPLPDDTEITAIGPDAYQLDVELPSGAYATVLLAELIRPESGVVERNHDPGSSPDR